jgi:hypothetical protein
MRKDLFFLFLIGVISIQGCATMIRGTTEPLYVTSEPSGALAELSDGQKGTTPCQFVLKRNQSLNIKYSKDGYYSENLTVYPTLAGAGVILGGLIDYGTGAVYSLTPNPAHVMLKPKEGDEKSSSKQSPQKPKPTAEQKPDINKQGSKDE